jgi:hypothetical protein
MRGTTTGRTRRSKRRNTCTASRSPAQRLASRVALACETKKTGEEADALERDLKLWCSGTHPDRDRPIRNKNHYRKYLGLLDHKPRGLWIIEPGTFANSPDRLFRVNVKDDGIVQLASVRDPRAF